MPQRLSTKSGWRRILNSSNATHRRLGVVGHPISHSLSPALHNAAYGTMGLEWAYDAIDIEPGGLGDFVNALDSTWRGLSVTMPHKTEALAISDEVDVIARRTGAVNTLVFDYDVEGNRSISGYNTDVTGIVWALGETGVHTAVHVAVVGGGATAASAIVASAELGAERVTILVRNSARAQPLIAVGASVGVVVALHDIADLASVAPVDLAISTLPGDVTTSLASLPRVSRAALLDVAYNPWPSIRGDAWVAETPSGGIVVSGKAMLAHQALVQVRLFTQGDGSLSLPTEESVRKAMFHMVQLA